MQRLLGLLLAVWILAPLPLRAASAEDLQRAIIVANQEIELLKAQIEAMAEEISQDEASIGELQARLDEAKRKLGELQLQLDRQGIAAAEEAKRVEALEEQVSAMKRFDVSGSLRVRGAYERNRADFTSQAKDQDFYASHRLLLDLTFHPARQVSVVGEIQDARLWGWDGAAVGEEVSELSINKAFARFEDLGLDGLTIDLGRMTLALGSERMIGENDWSNTGNTFDGLHVRYQPLDGLTLDALGFLIHERPAAEGADSTLMGLYGSYAFGEGSLFEGLAVDAYVLHLYEGLGVSSANVATLGLLVHGTLFEHAYIDMEGAIQVGKSAESPYGTRNPHLATAGYVELGYTQGGSLPFRVGLFGSGASGDAEPRDVPGNDRAVGFIPLFPSSHRYWGSMDLVSWTNLVSFGARAAVTPLPDLLSVELLYHEFYAADDRAPVPGIGQAGVPPLVEMGRHLAREIDLRLCLTPAAWGRAEIGYSVLLPQEGGEAYKGVADSDPVHWAYLMGTVSF